MTEGPKQSRVCVPVCVRRAEELRTSIERAARLADVVELRLDCLDEEQIGAALSQFPAILSSVQTPFIITNRPQGQGGRRALDTSERVGFWQAAGGSLRGFAAKGRACADIELDLFDSARAGELKRALDGFRLICSHHDFQRTPDDIETIYERMARAKADVIKIAARANDITDCLALFKLLARARREGREMIAVSMGDAGLLTRVLAPSRGAFLTYGSLDEEQATAPGQLGARELRELYRIDEIDERTIITGLVGKPVMHSLSPRIHNAAFKAIGLDAVYIPFEVADLGAFMRRMADPRTRELELNLRGLSVTAPHKSAVIPHLDWVEPKAREIGAVNTVRIEGDELRGYNTDAAAALKPLDGLIELSGARVAVIGAGGAARALLWSLRARGARATVFARNAERANALAGDFGADAAKLEGAAFEDFDVVVNATPLGTRGERENETPATAEQLRGARVAYDLVYNPSETRFMREARAALCEAVGGTGMLVAQAEEQFRLWTGADAPADAMRSAVRDSTG